MINAHQSGWFLRLSITESSCLDPPFFRAPSSSQKAWLYAPILELAYECAKTEAVTREWPFVSACRKTPVTLKSHELWDHGLSSEKLRTLKTHQWKKEMANTIFQLNRWEKWVIGWWWWGVVNYSQSYQKCARAIVLLGLTLSLSIRIVKSWFVVLVLSSTHWCCFSS